MLLQTLASKYDRFTIPTEVRTADADVAKRMASRANKAAMLALAAAGSDDDITPMTSLQAIQLSTLDQLFRYLCTEMIPRAMGCERHLPAGVTAAAESGGAGAAASDDVVNEEEDDDEV